MRRSQVAVALVALVTVGCAPLGAAGQLDHGKASVGASSSTTGSSPANGGGGATSSPAGSTGAPAPASGAVVSHVLGMPMTVTSSAVQLVINPSATPSVTYNVAVQILDAQGQPVPGISERFFHCSWQGSFGSSAIGVVNQVTDLGSGSYAVNVGFPTEGGSHDPGLLPGGDLAVSLADDLESAGVATPSVAGFYPWDLYVAQAGGGSITQVNLTGLQPALSTIPVGQNPVRVVASPDGSYIYVADQGSNAVSFVNRGTSADEADIAAGTGPVDLTFQQVSDPSPSDQQFLLVSDAGSQTVTRINVANRAADATWDYKANVVSDASGSFANFTPAGIVSAPASSTVYVVSSKVITSPGCSSNCSTIGVVSVLQNNPEGSLSAIGTVDLPGAVQPYRAVVDPRIGNLFISDEGAPQVFEVQGAAGASPKVTRIAIPSGSPTSGLAVSPDGSTLYATMPSSNEWVVIDIGTQVAKPPDGGVGTQPGALSMTDDGGFIWIGSSGNDDLSFSDLTGVSCNALGQVCEPQGPISYTASGSAAVAPSDLLVLPAL